MSGTRLTLCKGDVTSLTAECELLGRILRVSQLQHGRAIYYQRLQGAQKRFLAAIGSCADSAVTRTDGPLAACKAVERALEAIPSAWAKLQHLLAQTYFMPFALACIALLSRVATLLASIHRALDTDPTSEIELPLLLTLTGARRNRAPPARQPILGAGSSSETGGSSTAAASVAAAMADPPAHLQDGGGDDEDDFGECVDDDLFFIDALPMPVQSDVAPVPMPDAAPAIQQTAISKAAPQTNQSSWLLESERSPPHEPAPDPGQQEETAADKACGSKRCRTDKVLRQEEGTTHLLGMGSLLHAHMGRWAAQRHRRRAAESVLDAAYRTRT